MQSRGQNKNLYGVSGVLGVKKLLISVVCLVGFAASLYDVAEANNPMPIPDYDQVCQYNCGGPSFSFEGLLWALAIPGIIFLLVMMNKK
jgi:hypothetical protein